MGTDLKELKALAVDDHDSTRRKLVAILTKLGVTVTEAQNGMDALEILSKQGPFDIVFTDIVMPEMDGFELCEEIRRTAEFRKLPVVVLSTHVDTHYIIKALRYGADDYIAKPMDAELVEKVIRRVFTPVLKGEA